MNCEKFAKHLPLLISGEVNEILRDACENHIQSCASCLESFAQANQAQFALPDSDAFTQSVLQATTPNLCAESEELLGDFIDLSLDEEQKALLTLHLKSCVHCQNLHQSLQVIGVELALIAEQEPPNELLDIVLQHTLGKQQIKFSFPKSVAKLYTQFLLRPRFALEASFAATLLWTLLFGVPTSVIPTSFAEQSLATGESQLQKAWTQALTNIEIGFSKLGPELSSGATSLEDVQSRFFQSSASFAQESCKEIWQEFSSFLDTLDTGFLSGQDLIE